MLTLVASISVLFFAISESFFPTSVFISSCRLLYSWSTSPPPYNTSWFPPAIPVFPKTSLLITSSIFSILVSSLLIWLSNLTNCSNILSIFFPWRLTIWVFKSSNNNMVASSKLVGAIPCWPTIDPRGLIISIILRDCLRLSFWSSFCSINSWRVLFILSICFCNFATSRPRNPLPGPPIMADLAFNWLVITNIFLLILTKNAWYCWGVLIPSTLSGFKSYCFVRSSFKDSNLSKSFWVLPVCINKVILWYMDSPFFWNNNSCPLGPAEVDKNKSVSFCFAIFLTVSMDLTLYVSPNDSPRLLTSNQLSLHHFCIFWNTSSFVLILSIKDSSILLPAISSNSSCKAFKFVYISNLPSCVNWCVLYLSTAFPTPSDIFLRSAWLIIESPTLLLAAAMFDLPWPIRDAKPLIPLDTEFWSLDVDSIFLYLNVILLILG